MKAIRPCHVMNWVSNKTHTTAKNGVKTEVKLSAEKD